MVIYLPELSADPSQFPSPEQAMTEPDGLLAMGGDLSVTRLQQAYRQGIFPWFSEGDPLLWWSPSCRATFEPGSLSPNRTLRKQLGKHRYRILLNQHFTKVIQGCSDPRPTQQGTWILPEMQQAYLAMHQAGLAHCVEVWRDDELVGGCYGVQTGLLFCGESMFNREANAAKIAVCALQYQLQRYGGGWIDCQLMNPFLQQLGATSISRTAYLQRLSELGQLQLQPGCWASTELPELWWHE
ncbi:leucyl/phenylalanyl-tRNA--protein transferase [Rheinheimera sp.]|uniref:leucyl/phenylalanyl-tRNA--protein transferase n=1 Tax=Rheinheimera sp. TaxID=1869214 RepID=UPI00307D47E0